MKNKFILVLLLTILIGSFGYTGKVYARSSYRSWNDGVITENDDDNNLIASGQCGEKLNWTLTKDGVLTIAGTGSMYDYNSGDEYSSKKEDTYAATETKKIIIQDGVTSIGAGAFYKFENLESITIADSVTSIGEYAFYRCSSLTGMKIPGKVTSIGESTFSYCSSLTSIIIPYGVTSIGDYAFSRCECLTSITIPDSVTSIGEWAFTYCEKLSSITLPDNLTSIGKGAFIDCDGLTSVTIPSGVTSIGDYTFQDCDGLISIIIPSGVTSIGKMAFYGCESLTNVTISDGVTSIGENAFSDCNSLTSVLIPSSVTSIGYAAFYNRDSSFGVTVTIPFSVTSIGSLIISYDSNSCINCFANSTAHEYALEYGYNYHLLTECAVHQFDSGKVTKAPTCSENGVKKYTCTKCYYYTKEENIPATGQHSWDNGVVTKEATESSEGIRTFTCSVCKSTKTEKIDKLQSSKQDETKQDSENTNTIKDETTKETASNSSTSSKSAEATSKSILTAKTDKDPSNSQFATIQAKLSKASKSSIKISWTAVKGASKYIVFGNKCGKAYGKLAEVKAKSYTQKKLTKGTYYKYLVVAVDNNNQTLSVSKTIHTCTLGGKTTNIAKVTTAAKKNKVTIKKGKTFSLKAKVVKKSKKLKLKNHRTIAYESSNTKIATVSKKGVIKGVGKGTCYVYAYAQNGVYAKIKVTVK